MTIHKSIFITQPDEPELVPADVTIDAEAGKGATCESCGKYRLSFVTAELPEEMYVSECLVCFMASDWDKIELAT